MRYGFLIDHNRCIGCHACKEEHDVPLGVYRTWLKYIEKGEFPNTRRYFGVLRSNHCDDAPWRLDLPDGLVVSAQGRHRRFRRRALHRLQILPASVPVRRPLHRPANPDRGEVQLCTHRVEVRLEPACVIVCPEQAIVSGDLDDRESKISRTVATQKVSMRKPGKGTKPKLFYAGIDEDLLRPTMIEPQSSHLWAEKAPGEDL